MALIDKIFGRKKTLSELDRQELRKEEIILTKQRDRLFKRIEQISAGALIRPRARYAGPAPSADRPGASDRRRYRAG